MREDKGECQSACNVALVHKVCSERVQSCTRCALGDTSREMHGRLTPPPILLPVVPAFRAWLQWCVVLHASFSVAREGVVSLACQMDVKKSWVARYQRLKPNYVPGCYAVSVIGELPEEVLEMLDDARVAYIKRDFVDRSVATALK